MLYSESYSFNKTTIDDFITEAYQRCGMIGNEITGLQVQSAIMSANLELISWQGNTPLQFTKKMFLTPVQANETTVAVDPNVTKIIDALFTQPVRLNKNGVAISSSTPVSGSAQNCFLPTSFGGCSLNGVNSWIGFQYQFAKPPYPCIAYVGIEGLLPEAKYQFAIEYSFDGNTWVTAYTTPLRKYLATSPLFWVVEKTSNAQYWRVKEVSGSTTLDLNQIYFCVPSQNGSGDRQIKVISETTYLQYPLKGAPNSGFPTTAFYNPQVSPYMKLWPVISPQAISSNPSGVTCILYSGYQYIQSVTQMFENFDIPPAFYEALVSALAKRLCLKNVPLDELRYKILSSEAEIAFQKAAFTGAGTYSLSFVPDFNMG